MGAFHEEEWIRVGSPRLREPRHFARGLVQLPRVGKLIVRHASDNLSSEADEQVTARGLANAREAQQDRYFDWVRAHRDSGARHHYPADRLPTDIGLGHLIE